jgi:hypothetical protein
VASACVLASCASINVTTTPYVGAPQLSPSDPARVEILHAPPARPHARLGEVVVDASTDPAPRLAEVEERVRAGAGKLGADAVIVVSDSLQPVAPYVVVGPGWWRAGDAPIIRRKLVVGVAITYREATSLR